MDWCDQWGGGYAAGAPALLQHHLLKSDKEKKSKDIQYGQYLCSICFYKICMTDLNFLWYTVPVQAMNIIPYPRFVVVDTDSLKKEKTASKKILFFSEPISYAVVWNMSIVRPFVPENVIQNGKFAVI